MAGLRAGHPFLSLHHGWAAQAAHDILSYFVAMSLADTASNLPSSCSIASDDEWPSWPSPGTKLTNRVCPEIATVGLPPSATFTLLMRLVRICRAKGVEARNRSIPTAALVRASKARPRVSASAART